MNEIRMEREWVEIRRCTWLHQAELIRSVLESAGLVTRKGVGMSWPGFDGHLKRRHDEASAEVRHGTATTIHS
jgi:hypothetical protein